MEKRESMWERYLRKGMSRRSFLKGCVALTTLMGLSTDKLSEVVEAAETKPLPVVVWIHGHECTGCDVRRAVRAASRGDHEEVQGAVYPRGRGRCLHG